MSLYVLTFLLVVLLLLISLLNKKCVEPCYYIAFIALTALVVFRYGQGADYLSYAWIFSRIPDTLSISAIRSVEHVSTEFGWNFICAVFKVLGLEFKHMTMCLGIVEMLLINRFIRKTGFGRYKLLMLLLVYPSMYLIYMFSILREGLVLAVFLGILLPLFNKKHYLAYVILVACLTLVHTSAIALLAIFIVKLVKTKYLEFCIIPSLVIGIVINRFGIGFVEKVVSLLGNNSYLSYMNRYDVNWLAIIERIVMLMIILYLYKTCDNDDGNIDVLVRYYILGVCIYFLLLSVSLFSSRIGVFFKIVEIWLIPQMLSLVRKERRIQLATVIVLITFGMTLKNIGSEIENGNYNEDINVLNYPYVSVFDEEEIFEYRSTIFDEYV